MRRFNPAWFKENKNWLEYSIEKDAVFCLSGGDTFVAGGFTTLNKKERLRIHVGGLNSAHNQAVNKCEVLMKQKQHIEIDCIRFLLRQVLAFRGHDESNDSSSKGNFLELCF
ncbi:hypothetical protein CsSME_00002664 [Camellia sinensis var. sinensis]